jgi:hypothetical protein
MNTLTGIEAERVSLILKHAIDRLVVLQHVPTSWDGDEDVIANISSQAVLASLERQWVAEEQLNEIGDMVGSSEAGGKEISILKQAHRATRATCRDSLQALMGRPEIQSEEFSRFLRYLMELKSHVTAKLTTTVEDEAANRTILHDLTEKERNMEEVSDRL